MIVIISVSVRNDISDSPERLPADLKNPDADKKTEYQDNADRTEVRRRSGLGLSHTGPEDTTKSSILSADLLFLWKTGTGELLRRNYL